MSADMAAALLTIESDGLTFGRTAGEKPEGLRPEFYGFSECLTGCMDAPELMPSGSKMQWLGILVNDMARRGEA